MKPKTSSHFKYTALGLCILLTIMSTGCRRVKNIYSQADEVRMGAEFAKAFAKGPDGKKVISSGNLVTRLQNVARPVIDLARKDWDVPYTVTLLDDDEVNAFAVPGGPIYVNTGLMRLASTDEELASVLAHEASHIVRRHSAKQLSDSAIKSSIVGLLLGNANKSVRTVVGLTMNIKDREFSRGDESDADTYGFKYLVQAGYDGHGMASMFTKMQTAGSKTNEKLAFLSTHPLTRKRIEAAQQRAIAFDNGMWSAPK